ncbi:uncharacterized protein YcnI [Branchiibius hedensis]|uniref:Uncharacterized protein YcnI n=1 Tax=Branchiibius hedensis TaxID=672460 RepID=A0A2Y8ZRZ1_9MICO|nr:YcnI family protein [Branchiibius hedensis]PWJ26348.1 uncharacterized protein YcnI [Branchiibius hedensis]SSA35160.1 Uncharacterized protein YcnI [Branchiibius hedensis]
MRLITRTAATAVTTLALTLGVADVALAHVRVIPSSTTPGSYSVLTFNVPVESDTANTVALTVNLPTTTPFTYVSVRPTQGWTAKVTTENLANPVKDDDGNIITKAPIKVEWTATDGGLTPGQFGQFAIQAGPLPKAGTVYLPTQQKYSDGKTSNWVQQAQGKAEPEFPAPSFQVTAAAAASPAATDGGTNPWALAGGGAATALLGGVVGGVIGARVARRRSESADSGTSIGGQSSDRTPAAV